MLILRISFHSLFKDSLNKFTYKYCKGINISTTAAKQILRITNRFEKIRVKSRSQLRDYRILGLDL